MMKRIDYKIREYVGACVMRKGAYQFLMNDTNDSYKWITFKNCTSGCVIPIRFIGVRRSKSRPILDADMELFK